MYENPDSYRGPRLTSKGDPRITPYGSWLRITKINELPQLWNVLKGEMSLVGPRPEDPEIAKSWPEEARSKILSIKPGITSPASILYHDEEDLLSQKNAMTEYYLSILPEKIRLDLLYVLHHSFFSDLDTIFWTAAILIPRWTSTKIPEGNLFAGPFFRIANRYASWFVCDLIESMVVIGATAIIWRTQMPLNWGEWNILIFGVAWAFLFSGINSISGLNRIIWSQATTEDGIGLLLSGAFVTFLMLVINHILFIINLSDYPSLPTPMIVIIGLAALTSFITTRYRFRLLMVIANRWLALRRNTLALGDRLLVVGDGEASRIATWLLSRQMFRAAFSIVGIVNENDPTKHGMKVNGSWMLGTFKDIPKLIEQYDIGVVLSAGKTTSPRANEYIFDLCQAHNIRLIFLNDLLLMVDRQVTQPVGSFEYPLWLDERLEFKAVHHAITGLPNRFLFQDRLKHFLAYTKRYKTGLAVLLVKINGLDGIREKIGCKYGDQILIEIAERLTNCGRESDTLAYVAENIFGMILQNISDENAAEIVTRKILACLSHPFKAENKSVNLTAEIKVFTDTQDYDDLRMLCMNEIGMVYFKKNEKEIMSNYARDFEE
jgi:diguanylate cyclase (GGDEF)-like protein